MYHGLTAKIWPEKVARWCADGDFWRFLAFCISNEPLAVHFRPAF